MAAASSRTRKRRLSETRINLSDTEETSLNRRALSASAVDRSGEPSPKRRRIISSDESSINSEQRSAANDNPSLQSIAPQPSHPTSSIAVTSPATVATIASDTTADTVHQSNSNIEDTTEDEIMRDSGSDSITDTWRASPIVTTFIDDSSDTNASQTSVLESLSFSPQSGDDTTDNDEDSSASAQPPSRALNFQLSSQPASVDAPVDATMDESTPVDATMVGAAVSPIMSPVATSVRAAVPQSTVLLPPPTTAATTPVTTTATLPATMPVTTASAVVNRSIQFRPQLVCAICRELLCDPVSVNCGHTFCRHCITRWMTQYIAPQCPNCKGNMIGGPSDLRPDRLIMSSYVLKSLIEDTYPTENNARRNETTDEREQTERMLEFYCEQLQAYYQFHPMPTTNAQMRRQQPLPPLRHRNGRHRRHDHNNVATDDMIIISTVVLLCIATLFIFVGIFLPITKFLFGFIFSRPTMDDFLSEDA